MIMKIIDIIFPVRVIVDDDGSPYISRRRIIGWMPGSTWKWPFSIYIHTIHRADGDRDMHNHPWKWAFSVILSGWYEEERPYGRHGWRTRHRLRPFQVNRIDHGTIHRIAYVATLNKTTRTLFVCGPKIDSWGFYDEATGKITPWRDRLRARGIKPQH